MKLKSARNASFIRIRCRSSRRMFKLDGFFLQNLMSSNKRVNLLNKRVVSENVFRIILDYKKESNIKDKISNFVIPVFLNELIENVKHSRERCTRRIFFTSFRIHCMENKELYLLRTDSKTFLKKSDDGSIDVQRIVAFFICEK